MTVGALTLALSIGLVPAQAAPAPQAPPAPASTAPAPQDSAPDPGARHAASQAGEAAPGPRARASAPAPAIRDGIYAYDAARRLVGVTDPDGETARYRYDEAGNRLGVDRFPSTDLSSASAGPTTVSAPSPTRTAAVLN
ncbi:RHS repeat domain-containing protein [Streptomyces sp. NPDC004749]